MDEHGVPKYKGRKRGRKPNPRQRKANPDRRKRQHTAYTLFVKEHHAAIRAQDPDRPSSEIISMIAKQWAQVSAEDQKLWKQRALATHDDEMVEERPVYQHHGRDEEQVIYDDEEEVDEEDEDEDEDDDEEDEEGSDSPARRMPRR